jgi:transposase
VQRPSIRFVPVKRIEQQDIQSMHRIRSLLVARRTAQANQIRGLLLEYGIIIPKGIARIRTRMPEILEDAENKLTALFRELLSELYEEMVHLDERITTLE